MDKNLTIALALLIVSLIVATISAVKIFGEKKIRNWLVGAVCLAEKTFGSGTGQLKLRSVYNKFIESFPKLSSFISFERFSELVDEALAIMRKMLENGKIAEIIERK